MWQCKKHGKIPEKVPFNERIFCDGYEEAEDRNIFEANEFYKSDPYENELVEWVKE